MEGGFMESHKRGVVMGLRTGRSTQLVALFLLSSLFNRYILEIRGRELPRQHPLDERLPPPLGIKLCPTVKKLRQTNGAHQNPDCSKQSATAGREALVPIPERRDRGTNTIERIEGIQTLNRAQESHPSGH
ncbi:phage-like element PBSX protein XkdJ [Striga asiatica]|uniref:Phage-like element PBSX protein XkdJ n=1 Tax=Striga asiatica TaxID=4170 RepID=A0A5A7R5Y7_STRAF|nr:phage-like element PBSX protein XkdJ [Striga asiatica]